MDSILQPVVQFMQEHLAFLININSVTDLFQLSVGTIVVIAVMMYMAFYTIKRVIKNLLLGYVVLYAFHYIFNITIEPTAIMVALMALFGPIPVVLATVWHWIM